MLSRTIRSAVVAMTAALMLATTAAAPASAEGPNAVRTNGAFNSNTLARNDDGSTPRVPIGFPINFFGTTYTSLWVNNNGNVTLDGPLSTYTPFNISSAGRKIIAPFFADVDTRAAASNLTRYGYGAGTVDGRPAFGVNWINVGYYNFRTDKLNSFQLVLIDRSDLAPGAFDIEFNYDKILWETGDASGGRNGLGGASARAGWANGGSATYEIAGSAVNGAFLNANTSSGLIHNRLNSTQLGRYVFFVRNGVVQAPVTNPVTANAGSDASGNEGDLVSLNGSRGGDNVTSTWTATPGAGVDAGATCAFTNAASATTGVRCTDDGTWTMTLTATAGSQNATDTAIVTLGNLAPTLADIGVSPAGETACPGGNVASATFSASDAGANDTIEGSIAWGDGTSDAGFTGSHAYPAGSHTVTMSATDDDGGLSTVGVNTIFLYDTSGVLEPIAQDGTSRFKLGRTIPVKVIATDCTGAVVTTLAPQVSLTRQGDAAAQVVSSSGDTGTTMRWTGEHYHYNLSTKLSRAGDGTELQPGRYLLSLSAPEIAPVEVLFDLVR